MNNKGGIFLRLFRREGNVSHETPKVVTDDDGTKCKICGFTAKSKGGLNLHTLRKHK